MIKKILKRASIGALISIVYCDLIALIISFIIGDGNYHPVAAGFYNICSTETGAVLLQYITLAIFGCAAGGASVIFEIEKWSLLKRTIIHFIILIVAISLTILLAGSSIKWVFIWFGIFIAIYTIIWFIIYFKTRRDVSEINDILKK